MNEKFPEQYIIQNLLALNSDLLSKVYAGAGELKGKTMLEAATLTDTQQCLFFDQVVRSLRDQVTYPMAYIIDEHNEIFAKNLQRLGVFSRFTIMTDILSGVCLLF